ncbi:hypothetical protein NHX12_020512 [Muraenolepis orangiensis]|uniref:ETS domain-containing protein n=1 Tax=Muraenolepis orangiensis TaxID=630683 RepID=A0A9Q0IWQ1_9TELE|nr:hypothetical protein NHX12_020512 [Muraenolepis orangiensis]
MVSAEGQPCKMSSLDTDINQHFQDAIDVIQHHSDSSFYDPEYKYYETLGLQNASGCQISCYVVTPTHPDGLSSPMYDWNGVPQQSWPPGTPDVSVGQPVALESPQFYPVLPPPRNGRGRKKLRLYEYLHEALGDPAMSDSIQWTDSASGTFHFVSKNKERLAECWGQRKGNRKTMTYQKMARALRNYSRTGEILKVRRKLTYQFDPNTLLRLGGTDCGARPGTERPSTPDHSTPGGGAQPVTPPEPGRYGPLAPDWYSCPNGPNAPRIHASQFGHFGGEEIRQQLNTRFLSRGPCLQRPPYLTQRGQDVDNQSDLEVIMDFLEEYYRQNLDLEDSWSLVSLDNPPGDHQPSSPHTKPVLLPILMDHGPVAVYHDATTDPNRTGPSDPWTCTERSDPEPDAYPGTRASPLPTPPGTGRKTRLFHFLFEMLEDPAMAHCVSWANSGGGGGGGGGGVGVFRFSSGNKERVAALWGQRKGNKRPMTYQKMSRALRNYARSGEIFKVKKKLTYRFGPDTLRSLRRWRRARR